LRPVKRVAEVASRRPRPRSEAVIAVKSPSATPAVVATAARLPLAERVGHDQEHGRPRDGEQHGGGGGEGEPELDGHGLIPRLSARFYTEPGLGASLDRR
jgi:hypothetical protein